MNEVLQKATKFYEACLPIEALQKLEELKKDSEQSILLKNKCIRLLIQQTPYLLQEHKKNNDIAEIKYLIDKYKKYVGNDKTISEYCKFYEAYEIECKKQQTENNIKKARQTEKKAMIIVYSILVLLVLFCLIFI